MSDMALAPAAPAVPARRANIVRAVATKEFLEMRRDRRLLALFAFAALLTLAALGFGAAENARLARERAAAAEADRLLWTNQGAKNPHAAAHFGQYAFKPASPLSLSPIPASIRLSARRFGSKRTSRTRRSSGRPATAAPRRGSAGCRRPSFCKPSRRSSCCSRASPAFPASARAGR